MPKIPIVLLVRSMSESIDASVSLRNYQESAIRHAIHSASATVGEKVYNGHLIWHGHGTGKTLTAAHLVSRLAQTELEVQRDGLQRPSVAEDVALRPSTFS